MHRFIAGTNILSAIKRVQNKPFVPIFDYAKEASRTADEAKSYSERIKKDALVTPPKAAFALKFSSFNDSVLMSETVNYMIRHVQPILLDAEDDRYHQKEKDLYDTLLRVYNQSDTKLYKTYQMYRIDSMKQIVEDIKTYQNLGIKLVRGAYHNTDVNTNKLFTNKYDTDNNYNNGIKYVVYKIKSSRPDLKLMIATHNEASIKLAIQLKPENTSFAQLLGMKDNLSHYINSKGYTVYKYTPYGSPTETYPYLMRRLYENYSILKHIM